MKIWSVLVGVAMAIAALADCRNDRTSPDELVFENAAARLILGTNGVARSLMLKATGEVPVEQADAASVRRRDVCAKPLESDRILAVLRALNDEVRQELGTGN